jgi:hypothetical protein
MTLSLREVPRQVIAALPLIDKDKDCATILRTPQICSWF